MSGAALALVLVSAAAHASWNLLFKQASGGVVFTWLAMLASACFVAPFAVVEIARGEAGVEIAALAVASGCMHVAYILSLQRAYRDGDLSHVYPLSRGLGALLTALVAVLALGESPSAPAAFGIAAILGALLWLGLAGLRRGDAMLWALVTGVSIAAYTLCDKNAVDDFDNSPLLYFWLNLLTMCTLLGAIAARRRERLRRVWSDERRAVLAFGVLGPTSYALVLLALATSPASYVAPVREVSVVMGALLGTMLLGEEGGRQRIAAAAAVAVGVVAIALG
jgi:drug/metabolite transporter (DMT)-like permease